MNNLNAMEQALIRSLVRAHLLAIREHRAKAEEQRDHYPHIGGGSDALDRKVEKARAEETIVAGILAKLERAFLEDHVLGPNGR